LTELEVGIGSETLLKNGGESAIDFDGFDVPLSIEQETGDGSESGTDFENAVFGMRGKTLHDETAKVFVEEKVLTELFERAELVCGEETLNFAESHGRGFKIRCG
jgi:hypothetical protein